MSLTVVLYCHTFSFPRTPVDISHGGEGVEKDFTKHVVFNLVQLLLSCTTLSVVVLSVFNGTKLTNPIVSEKDKS